MKRFIICVEGAAYFYVGALTIFILGGITRTIEARFGYGYPVEGGLGLEMLMLIGLTVVYYGAFLIAQFGFARLCKRIVELQWFLPASLATGGIVGFVFISELDFLFWLLYRKDMGTIFLSALVVELIFLIINFGIVWRIVNSDKLTLRNVRMTILLLLAGVALLALGVPLLFE
jgi:hypothetical protein